MNAEDMISDCKSSEWEMARSQADPASALYSRENGPFEYFPNENPQGFIYINGVFKDIKAPDGYATTTSGINGYGDVIGEIMVSGSTGYTAHCQ